MKNYSGLNLYDFHFSVEHKRRYYAVALFPYDKVNEHPDLKRYYKIFLYYKNVIFGQVLKFPLVSMSKATVKQQV